VSLPLPRSRRRSLAPLLAAALASAPVVPAGAGPAEDKATARELAKDGITAAGGGDCVTAVDRLERAEALFHAPPHLQHLARCYAKLGRLVDATETWRKLTLEPLAPNAPPAFKEAVAEANVELPKLEPRLAHLTLRAASKYDGLAVEVDGRLWPSAALEVPRVIDPGTHVVKARASGFKEHERSLSLAEGASETLTLQLEASAAPVASAPTSAKPVASSSTGVPPTTAPRSPLRWVGVGLAGVGVLALAGGAFTGLSANAEYAKLESDCPVRSSCAIGDLEQRKTSIRRLDAATNVLLIGGGVLAAAGLTLTLLAPSRQGETRTVGLSIAPFSSGGHVSVAGSF
jgi:hypothetical protein